MKFKSFGYCFVQGIKNIGRNRIFSLASAATMTLCIFLIGVFYSITSNINYNIDNISQGLCVKVFFQNDITEAKRKVDRSNVEVESLKKENRSLRQELDAAERRIQKLTDELIKNGGELKTEEPVKREEPRSTVVKPERPEPIFAEPVQEEPKAGNIKDIFADLRKEAAQEAAEEKKPEPVVKEAEPITSEDGEEVYAGEVEVKVDESMLIGNDDDEDEGFNFL